MATIDLAAIEHNVTSFQNHLGPDVALMAVVKADGYGHGALPVLKKALKAGASWAAVALPEEARALRQGGIECPILLLGGLVPDALPLLLKYNITPAAYSLDSLQMLQTFAQGQGISIDVHLKLDTGMGRLGLNMAQLQDLMSSLKAYSNLNIEGLMSHYAAADEADSASALAQQAKFNEMQKLVEAQIKPRWVHLANSAGASELPAQGNLARLGVSLYGMPPAGDRPSSLDLTPALRLQSSIIQLQWQPAGQALGYGGTFVTERPSLIAALAVGYGDGYNRLLSNQGRVLLHGRTCPIVGRVSMDLTLVDVTLVPEVSLYDPVTLIGAEGEDVITATEMPTYVVPLTMKLPVI